MNKFLSKAKKSFDGQWITGFHVHSHTGAHVIYDGYEDEFGNECVEIDIKTLCQCTGLKDKNGKLIFESDKVRHDKVMAIEFIVCHDKGCFWVGLNPLFENHEHLEIIGNIHDTKQETIVFADKDGDPYPLL